MDIRQLTRGGEFLVSDIQCDEIFTPEDFSEDQLMMKSSVKEFNEREIISKRDRFESKDFKLTEDVMRKAGKMGFLSISVPEEYGGSGMGLVSSMLVCEYISSGNGSFSTAFGAHTGIGTMPIILYGTKKQKEKYVHKLASGEWFGAYCLTEPNAGSDANSGKTVAKLSEDGTHYRITGQKMWISNAGFCDLFIVFARIENDKNITGFIVENKPENGIILGEEENKLGINASSTRQVFFNNTKVPIENMLSNRQDGFKIAINSLNIGRIKLAAACIDSQRRITNDAIKYANERQQFNSRISKFGAIKFKLAEMATNTYVGESASYRAAKNIEDFIEKLKNEGKSHQEAQLKGVEEFAIECSILKVAVSEDIQNCADEGIQILGGMGFSKETPMEAAWRDARITRIYEGTNEINRMLIVGMLIKKSIKGQLNLFDKAVEVKNELLGIPSFSSPDFSSPLSQEKWILKNLKKIFFMVAGAGLEKFGPEIEEHQQLLIYASDILIEIYMVESAVLRTEKNIVRYGDQNQKYQIKMTQLYVYNSVEIIYKNAKSAIISISAGEDQKMLLMGLKRFTKYINYPNVAFLRNSIADKLNESKQYFIN